MSQQYALLDPERPVVVLSHGMGQDSAAALAAFTNPDEPEIRRRFVGDATLLVIHSDTGAEHPETIAYRSWVRDYCAAHGAVYFQVDRDLGFHTGHAVNGLHGMWDATNTISSVAFPSTCSDRLKITPIWHAINRILADSFDVPDARKNGIYEYMARFGKRLRSYLNFAKGEEGRLDPVTRARFDLKLFDELVEAPPRGELWFDRNVSENYPLLELGIDRAAAQRYLRERGQPVPRPSLCTTCHWKSKQEVLHLQRTLPEYLAYWLMAEERKIAANPGKERNYGVKGAITLKQFLAEAEAEYGHLSTEELYEYVMTHGHCMFKVPKAA